MIGRIGCSNRSDRPKSPTRTPPTKARYWAGSGRSRPWSRWNSRTASALASSPRMSRAGSPLSRRSENVASVIPIQTRTRRPTRARRYVVTRALSAPNLAEDPQEVPAHDLPGVVVRVPPGEEAQRDVAHLRQRVDLGREDPRERRVDHRPVRLVRPVPQLARLRHHLERVDLLRQVRAEANVIHPDQVDDVVDVPEVVLERALRAAVRVEQERQKADADDAEIGRASCRERVEISVWRRGVEQR